MQAVLWWNDRESTPGVEEKVRKLHSFIHSFLRIIKANKAGVRRLNGVFSPFLKLRVDRPKFSNAFPFESRPEKRAPFSAWTTDFDARRNARRCVPEVRKVAQLPPREKRHDKLLQFSFSLSLSLSGNFLVSPGCRRSYVHSRRRVRWEREREYLLELAVEAAASEAEAVSPHSWCLEENPRSESKRNRCGRETEMAFQRKSASFNSPFSAWNGPRTHKTQTHTRGIRFGCCRFANFMARS